VSSQASWSRHGRAPTFACTRTSTQSNRAMTTQSNHARRLPSFKNIGAVHKAECGENYMLWCSKNILELELVRVEQSTYLIADAKKVR
jgi:hypothetical protein